MEDFEKCHTEIKKKIGKPSEKLYFCEIKRGTDARQNAKQSSERQSFANPNDMSCLYLTRKLIRRLPGKVMKLIPMPRPDVFTGPACRSRLGALCREKGFGSVLILTDRTLCDLGFLQAVEASLAEEGIRCSLYDGIVSEPRLDYIAEGRRLARECGAECLVALGGGSVMDTAKMIAAGCRLKCLPTRLLLQKFLIVPRKTLPLMTIPSTAGTGAETTVGAVICKPSGGKFAAVIAGLDIRAVLLDSQLGLQTPWAITAACGIDALSHGLEGVLADVESLPSDRDKSLECVRLVLENLPKLKRCPDDVAARGAMCLAAHYGGNAINKQLAGYVHAFAHAIGGRCHIPHGQAIALCLMPVLRAQQDSCRAQLARLAAHCGLPDAQALLEALENLLTLCDLRLDGSVVNPADYKALTRAIALDSINYSAPTVFSGRRIADTLDRIRQIR